MSSEVIQAEKYRPKFHFSPPANWMNDPNGLVYFKGNTTSSISITLMEPVGDRCTGDMQ